MFAGLSQEFTNGANRQTSKCHGDSFLSFTVTLIVALTSLCGPLPGSNTIGMSSLPPQMKVVPGTVHFEGCVFKKNIYDPGHFYIY